MKIAFVNDLVYAYASRDSYAVGGAERQQWLLGRALVARGWSVIVGVRHGIQLGERRTIDGVQFVGIGRSQILPALYKLFSSVRPDWCYWRGADHILGPAVELAKMKRVRTIFSTAFDADVHASSALSRKSRWWPLYAWGLARADRIFVQHMEQFTRLAPEWRLKTHIVPSIAGVHTAATSHSERANYVAWVGMLRQPKRPDLLTEIARRAPCIRFVVCGSPTTHRSPLGYGERIVGELCALPNVKYLGQVDADKAQQIIADAAVLLSTSDGEGFPNTFLQAWSGGTPVVSLKIDPDRIIEQNGLGAVSGSVEGAIADINALLNSPQQREEIAVRARRYVAKHHSESVVITMFNRAIQGISP